MACQVLWDSGQHGMSSTLSLQQEDLGISPNHQGWEGRPPTGGCGSSAAAQVWLFLPKHAKQPHPTPNEPPRQDDGAGMVQSSRLGGLGVWAVDEEGWGGAEDKRKAWQCWDSRLRSSAVDGRGFW